MTKKTVAVDCLGSSPKPFGKGSAAVVVDVIRSMTVAVTVVESGRRCFFIPSVEEALLLAKKLDRPLMVGEIGGNMPYGFDLRNSPVEILRNPDKSRPVILVSSSGIPLLYSLRNSDSVLVSCLRNYEATIERLSGVCNHVKVLGAPTRGEFREEDKLCCARIASGLIKKGYVCEDEKTKDLVDEWADKPIEVCGYGRSAKYLKETGQENDLDYILNHVNDFKSALTVIGCEIVKA